MMQIDLIFLSEDEKFCFEYDWIDYLLKDNFILNKIYIDPCELNEIFSSIKREALRIIVFSDNDRLSKLTLKKLNNKYEYEYGIIHLSDEWFLTNYSEIYKGALFVLRNYYNPSLSEKEKIFHFPLGPNLKDGELISGRTEEVKKHLIFFKGELKGERKEMINAFKKYSISIFGGSKNKLTYENYLKELSNCIYSLSPQGNTTPETLRVYECLENNVIPICGSSKTKLYFKLLFSKAPPFLFFENWNNASKYFKDNMYLKIHQHTNLNIRKWWSDEKRYMKKKIKKIIIESGSSRKNKIKFSIFKSFFIRIKSIYWLLSLQTKNSIFIRFKYFYKINLIKRIFLRFF